ncbi:uncharacterized protein [Typha latifolia]|uniref:uncharacterized protein n=1 Tax=Typha latifolia TaxID=4733 RepID=UPI003C3070CD
MITSNLLSFSPTSLPPPPSLRNPDPIPRPSLPSSPQPTRTRGFLCHSRRTGRPPWDSNVESVRPGWFRRQSSEAEDEVKDSPRKEKRTWWSDDSSDGLDDEFEFDPFDDDSFDKPWEKIWIFKVFRSYGYLLPAIIASMLLASGPKAFLMALAFPLGQSAISLAFDKVWGKAREGPRARPKTKKNPFARSTSDFKKQRQEESGSIKNGKSGYQTWVSADTGVADKGAVPRRPSFGGWDELDRQKGPIKGSQRRQAPKVNDSTPVEPVKKLSKRGKYRDAPLFWRLLIAVFPFLGSWTRIL